MLKRIQIGEVALACEDTGGDGPAVVFSHGLGGSKSAWLAQLEECRSRGWRGIAYDLRGAGRSSKPAGPYSVDVWAGDLQLLLDALEVERAALVGHSIGSMVAEHAALSLSDRVWALVLCGSALAWRPESGPVFEERVQMARAGRMDEIGETVAMTGLSEGCRKEDPRLLGLMRELIASNEPVAYADSAKATASATIADPELIGCPVLAVCGSEDPVAPPSAAQALAKAVPRGESTVIEGAAHWCMIENPAGTSAAIFDFLERADLPGEAARG